MCRQQQAVPASPPLVEVTARKRRGERNTVTPPAAALNLAIQAGDCLLSAGMSANDELQQGT
jgi:hypothetical protein